MDADRPRLEVRALVDEEERGRRVRGLIGGMLVCDLLVAAILLVGLRADWSPWALVAALTVPVAIGLLSVRTAYVLHRQRLGSPTG